MPHKVPVFDEDQKIVAHVEYSNNLDYWDGHNWTCGSTGEHLGLTVLKDGRFVLIHGTQWEGRRDHAEIVSADEALQAVLNSDSEALDMIQNYKRFAALKALYDERFANQELEDDEPTNEESKGGKHA